MEVELLRLFLQLLERKGTYNLLGRKGAFRDQDQSGRHSKNGHKDTALKKERRKERLVCYIFCCPITDHIFTPFTLNPMLIRICVASLALSKLYKSNGKLERSFL